MGILLTIISMIIGVVITWSVTYIYYKKAGDGLRQEADAVRRLTILMIRGMEEAGWVKYNRDEQGNPVGLVLQLSTHDSIKLHDALRVELIDKNSQES